MKIKMLFLTSKITFLAIVFIATVFPLYWMVITSFKSSKDIFTVPLNYWPDHFTLENYINIFKISNFQVYITNSLIVSLVSAFLTMLIALLGGYVLARYQFKGKNQIFLAFLVTQMIPIFISMAPLYLLMSNLELLNRLPSIMIMYTVMTIPFCTIMMRSFFQRIPASLEEAAMMDGCSQLGALFKVIVPVMLPGILSTFIFAFVQAWNELFLAVMFIDEEQMKTIPVAMNSFITKYDIDWGAMSAATVLSVLPTLILFSVAQKYIVEGMTDGAVKG